MNCMGVCFIMAFEDCVALGVDHDELVKLAEKQFSSIPSTTDLPKATPCRFTGSEVCSSCKEV